MQFVRTRPERRSTDGVEIATRPNSSRRNCKFAIRPDEFDFFFFRTRLIHVRVRTVSELVRTNFQLVRIHSLTVDGWVGVCIFAWQSSGRNRNFFELSGGRTSADEFESRPNSARRVYSLKDFCFQFSTSGRVCSFSKLIRTILKYVRTRPPTVEGRRG